MTKDQISAPRWRSELGDSRIETEAGEIVVDFLQSPDDCRRLVADHNAVLDALEAAQGECERLRAENEGLIQHQIVSRTTAWADHHYKERAEAAESELTRLRAENAELQGGKATLNKLISIQQQAHIDGHAELLAENEALRAFREALAEKGDIQELRFAVNQHGDDLLNRATSYPEDSTERHVLFQRVARNRRLAAKLDAYLETKAIFQNKS